MATYEEALKIATEYFGSREDIGVDLSVDAYLTKYSLRNPHTDEILEPTPDMLHRRLAREFARIEARYVNPLSEEDIYGHLKDFGEIVAQGSPMAGIGNPYQIISISNCFIATEELHDSYGGILLIDEQIAQIQKRRGGIGVDISPLRPNGFATTNAARTSEGIVTYAERFSNTTREVGQKGRRGALMITCSVHHPQILDFINMKRDRTKVTGANVSVRLSDEFMRAVIEGTDYEQRFPCDVNGLPLPPGAPRQYSKMVPARPIWDAIVDAAWDCAEPGILFWDTVLRMSPADCYASFGFRTLSTNPCGELPLSRGDSCRLMVTNLASFVRNPFTDRAEFDWERHRFVTRVTQRLMDDLVDLELEAVDRILAKIESDPEPAKVKQVEMDMWRDIRSACENGRRTGTGITALGDTLAMLGQRYGSEESIETTEAIYKAHALAAYRESVELAKERGAFPIWNPELEKGHPYLDRIMEADPELAKLHAQYGRRNIACLTTAPVGTTSLVSRVSAEPRLFGTTSGIECAPPLSYYRYRKLTAADGDVTPDRIDEKGDRWKKYKVYHPGHLLWREITGETDDTKSPYYGATFDAVDWVAGVRLQAGAQKWIDHAISRCMSGDTLITTNKGIFKLSELASHAPEGGFAPALIPDIASVNSAGERAAISEVYRNGSKPALRIRFDRGDEVVCTPQHKLFVLRDGYEFTWIEAAEIRAGDTVIGRKGLNLWNEDCAQVSIETLLGRSFEDAERRTNAKEVRIPTRLSRSLARFLGYLCSDGNVSENGVRLAQVDKGVREDFAALVEELFGLGTIETPDKRSPGLVSVVVNSRIVARFCRWLGVTNHNTIEVPEIIRRSSAGYVKEFLKGATLDGCVRKSVGDVILATSVSRPYLVQMQSLLLNIGIESGIYKSKHAGVDVVKGRPCNAQDAWTLTIAAGDDVEAFARSIGFAEERKNEELAKTFRRRARKKRVGDVPDYGLRERFRAEVLPRIRSNSLYEKFHGMTSADKRGRFLTRESVLEMVDMGLEGVEPRLLDTTYTFRQVQAVEAAGEVPTFDLSVPNGNSYIANGFVSHNTVNLPRDVSKEIVAEVYKMGWELGLKGMTVYREGSRDGVILSKEEAEKTAEKKGFIQSDAPKRPKELPCEVHYPRVQKEMWAVFVGLMDGKPYEVFGGPAAQLPSRPKGTGTMIRVARGKYDFVVPPKDSTPGLRIENIGACLETGIEGAYTRTISTALRHGTPVQFLVEQLQKGDKSSELHSLGKAIARVLKQYIPEGAKATGGATCESCGNPTLVYKEGCLSCLSCSHSKCG